MSELSYMNLANRVIEEVESSKVCLYTLNKTSAIKVSDSLGSLSNGLSDVTQNINLKFYKITM